HGRGSLLLCPRGDRVLHVHGAELVEAVAPERRAPNVKVPAIGDEGAGADAEGGTRGEPFVEPSRDGHARGGRRSPPKRRPHLLKLGLDLRFGPALTVDTSATAIRADESANPPSVLRAVDGALTTATTRGHGTYPRGGGGVGLGVGVHPTPLG